MIDAASREARSVLTPKIRAMFDVPAPRPRCSSRKNEYSSRGEARRALAIHRTNGGAVRRVYRCPECRYYHLTKLRA